jgi:hypothetical protein
MTYYVILYGWHTTYVINKACQYGCQKKPQDLSNQASYCKSMYNLIINNKMKLFKKNWKSFVYWIFDSRIVNQWGKLCKSIRLHIIAYRMSSQIGVILGGCVCKTGHPLAGPLSMLLRSRQLCFSSPFYFYRSIF